MTRSKRNRGKNKPQPGPGAGREDRATPPTATSSPVAEATAAPGSSADPKPEAGHPKPAAALLGPLNVLNADFSELLRLRNVRWLIVIAVIVVALVFGWYLSDVFVPLLVALGVAYMLNPLVDSLEKRGISRTRSVLLIFVGFIAAMLCVGSWFAVSVIADVRQIGAEIGDLVADIRGHEKEWVARYNQSAPSFAQLGPDFSLDGVFQVVQERIAPQKTVVGSPEEKQAAAAAASARAQFLGQFSALDANHDLWLTPGELDTAAVTRIDLNHDAKVGTDEWYAFHGAPHENGQERTLAPEARAVAEGVFSFAGRGVVWLLSLLLFVTLVPIYTWYFMIGLDDIGDKINRFLPGLHRARIQRILGEIDGMARAFFRGRLVVVFIISVLSTILFTAFGVKYAFLLGLMSGMGVLIPYFSFVAGWLPALILMAIAPNQSWLGIGAMSALFFVIQAFEQYFLTPKLLGNAVELHPVTLLVGVFVMSSLFGLFGALLAVPLTAIAKTLGREFVLPYFKSLADEKPPPASA